MSIRANNNKTIKSFTKLPNLMTARTYVTIKLITWFTILHNPELRFLKFAKLQNMPIATEDQ